MFRISEQKAENGRLGHSDENIVAETETIARTRPRLDRVMSTELWNKTVGFGTGRNNFGTGSIPVTARVLAYFVPMFQSL